MTGRTVCWFSAGGPSAVATMIALKRAKNEVVIVYTDPGSEHADKDRFIADCENWFGQKVVRLQSDKYVDTWDLWSKIRWLNGPGGAACTVQLKKKLRHDFQQADDTQVFGYAAEESQRAQRFRDNNPEVNLWTPLIEEGLSSEDCYAIVDRAGIKLPAMILMGYGHSNCVGCVKGGIGYWNKIRRDFPLTFDRMALLEREIGASCVSGQFLDELDPDRGNYNEEPDIQCSLMCSLASDELIEPPKSERN